MVLNFRKSQRGSTAIRYIIAVALGFLAVFVYIKISGDRQKPATAPASQSPASAPAAAGASAAASRASLPVPSSALVKPAGPSKKVNLQNDKLAVVATNRGARLTSVRLKGFGLTVDATEEERNDPNKSLELVFHSGAPVSAFAIYLNPTNYTDPSHPLRPLLDKLETADWDLEKIEAGASAGEGVRWSLTAGPLVFTKTFRLHKDGFTGDLNIEVRAVDQNLENSQNASGTLQFNLLPGGWLFSDNDRFSPSPYASVGRKAEGRSPIVENYFPGHAKLSMDAFDPALTDMIALASQTPDRPAEKFQFFADVNKYFVAALLPKDSATVDALIAAKTLGITVKNAEDRPEGRVATVALISSRLPKVDKPLQFNFTTYFGPKEYDQLAPVPDLREIHNADRSSWLSPGWLADGIAALLRLFHSFLGNWGIAIILLTICLRAAMFPLTRRSQVTLAEFGAKQAMIKPKLEELSQRYKDNPKKLNEERLRVMKENKVPIAPPIGGCLPLFLNIPIFVGFFAALRTMFELRHQPFGLWIHDLSRPDEVLTLAHSFQVPVLGGLIGEIRGLNILPILMIVMWIANQYVTQKNMPQSSDPQAKFTQRFTMILTTVMGLGLYNYASGLSVYSITSSTITLLEQTLIRKFWPPKTVAIAAKK